MSASDGICVCCLLVTGLVQLVEQEIFTVSDVKQLFSILCSFAAHCALKKEKRTNNDLH
jgi:hypothetical protein